MPYLIEDGYSRGQLGVAMSAIAIAYGLSKFIMGLVSTVPTHGSSCRSACWCRRR